MEPETAGGKIFRIVLSIPLIGVATAVWYDTYVNDSLRSLPQLAIALGSTLFFTNVVGLIRLRRDRKPGALPANKWAWFGVGLVLALVFSCLHYFAGRAWNVRMIEARFWESVPGKIGSEGPGGYVYWAKNTWGDEWWLETFTPFKAHLAEATAKYGEARYAEVMAKPEVKELRKYRAEFPGVHSVETAAPIAAKYREALANYDKLIEGKETDAESVKGLRALFTWLGEHDVDSDQVRVVFLPFEDLKAAEFEGAVQKETGAREVAPVSVAFTAYANSQRANGVLNSLNSAIGPISGELFQLSDRFDQVARPRFLVGEKVGLSGSLYSSDDEREWPMSKKKIFIGIAMTFDCTLQIPKGEEPLDDDLEHGFHFQLRAKPSPHIEARGREKIADEDIYGAMASSAFSDFRERLIKSYGL
jgi:hypothetical protein